MKRLAAIIFLLTTISVGGQNKILTVAGKYSDGITELELKADNTFVLKTPDYVFPYTFNNYQTHGNWTSSKDGVSLNPQKSPRKQIILLSEKIVTHSDSIEIKINYQTDLYENEQFVKREPADFDLMTLYINKSKNYHHLVHSIKIRKCSFAPTVKRQYVLDSSNSIWLAKQKVEKIGIYTYGFNNTIELVPQNTGSNYFVISIIQPIDKERTPRNKKIVIKGKKAFFYEKNGNVATSGMLLNSLKRTN